MGRECKKRRILNIPKCCKFYPCNILNNGLENEKNYEEVILSIDEYETIRCIDIERMTQEECSKHMGVARTTVQAIYENARYKVADFLVNQKILKINGGEFFVCDGKNEKCPRPNCERRQIT